MLRKLVSALVGLLLLAQTVHAIEIRHDSGGSIELYVKKVAALRSGNERVEITGSCLSACTLLLTLSTVCVSPNATLGFHGPRTRLAGIPLPVEDFERVSSQMALHYPEPIRSWFMREARYVTEGMEYVSGSQLIEMGVPRCR